METKNQSKFVNLFAIGGFAILLIVGLWSTIQVVKFVPRMFGGETLSMPSFSFGKDNTLKITLESNEANSGEPFTINWKNGKDNKDGILSFSYACKPGFHFRAQEKDAGDYTVLPCNAPYNIPASDTSLTVIPISDSNRYIDVPFAITYTNREGKSIHDTAELTVTNEKLSQSPDTLAENNPFENTATSTDDAGAHTGKEGATLSNVEPMPQMPTGGNIANYTGKEGAVINTASASAPRFIKRQVIRYIKVPTTPYSNPNGTADLSVEIVRVGAINPYTNAYEAKGVLRADDRAFVTLKVTNKGDKATGPWMFTASLPTHNFDTYTSKTQASLMPGATAQVTLTFDQLRVGRNNFRVDINPFRTIAETTHANNTAGYAFSIVNF